MTRRRVTKQKGSGPDYIGIGAGRSGTTSLHYALLAHPNVLEYRGKEMHFWDQRLARRGLGWYLNRFRTRTGQVAGEITPIYYRMPDLPARLAHHLPNVKLILLLRNPIDALFSDYRRGVHRRSFPGPFEEHVHQVLDEDGDREFFARRYYDVHVEPWLHHFPREQIWVAQSEKLWANPEEVLRSLWQFLGVSQAVIPYPHAHPQRHKPIPDPYRPRLSEHFRSHNQRLYALLGEEYDWD